MACNWSMFPIPFEASYWLAVLWRISSATGVFLPIGWKICKLYRTVRQPMVVIDKTLTRPTDVKNYDKKINDFNVTQNIPDYELRNSKINRSKGLNIS
jgi:hypothetical protein